VQVQVSDQEALCLHMLDPEKGQALFRDMNTMEPSGKEKLTIKGGKVVIFGMVVNLQLCVGNSATWPPFYIVFPTPWAYM